MVKKCQESRIKRTHLFFTSQIPSGGRRKMNPLMFSGSFRLNVLRFLKISLCQPSGSPVIRLKSSPHFTDNYTQSPYCQATTDILSHFFFHFLAGKNSYSDNFTYVWWKVPVFGNETKEVTGTVNKHQRNGYNQWTKPLCFVLFCYLRKLYTHTVLSKFFCLMNFTYFYMITNKDLDTTLGLT